MIVFIKSVQTDTLKHIDVGVEGKAQIHIPPHIRPRDNLMIKMDEVQGARNTETRMYM